MSIATGALIICALIGVIVTVVHGFTTPRYSYNRRTWAEAAKNGGLTLAVLAAFVLVSWFVIAVPVSNLNRSACKREAAGYRLDYDWSFRNNCRIRLSTGQLVPSDKIRITSDGDIITGEDD